MPHNSLWEVFGTAYRIEIAKTCNNLAFLRIYTIWDLFAGGFQIKKPVKSVLLSFLLFAGVAAGLFALLWGAGYVIFNDYLQP
jgi:uncharacterized membrane protein